VSDIPVGGPNNPLGPMHIESHQRSKDHIIDLEAQAIRRHFHVANNVGRTAGWKQWITLGGLGNGRFPMVMRLLQGNGGQILDVSVDWSLYFAGIAQEVVVVAENTWSRNPFWAGLRIRLSTANEFCIDFRIPTQNALPQLVYVAGDWQENGLGWWQGPTQVLEDFGLTDAGPGTVLAEVDPLVQGPNHLLYWNTVEATQADTA
jgi:hypothetical protein